MNRCTGICDITEVLFKAALHITHSIRPWVSLTMGPMRPEQLELFPLKLVNIAEFDFVYTLESTNLYYSITAKLGQNVCNHKI